MFINIFGIRIWRTYRVKKDYIIKVKSPVLTAFHTPGEYETAIYKKGSTVCMYPFQYNCGYKADQILNAIIGKHEMFWDDKYVYYKTVK